MTTFAVAFEGTPENVSAARHWLTGVLDHTPETRVPDDTRATAALLLSECATNAIRYTHSGDDGQKFTLFVRVDPGRVRVDVGNRRPRDVLSVPRVHDADPGDECGRGLSLVQGFADAWGVLPLGSGVYFVLTWPQAATPSPASAPLPTVATVE